MVELVQKIIVAFFLLGGCIEAAWGLGQLYGVAMSNHAHFILTGSFYNPGPYSGFLAMIFPIAFYEWLRRRKEPKSIARLVKEWNGKEIRFPEHPVFTILGKDTVDFSFRDAKPFRRNRMMKQMNID